MREAGRGGDPDGNQDEVNIPPRVCVNGSDAWADRTFGQAVHAPADHNLAVRRHRGDDEGPVANTKKGKQAARRERVAALRAQQKRAQ